MSEIKEVTAFEYNGKLHTTKLAAIKAMFGGKIDQITQKYRHTGLSGERLLEFSDELLTTLDDYKKKVNENG